MVADNALKLEGHPASYFATSDHTHSNYALSSHNHNITEINGLETKLSELENAVNNPVLTGQQEILTGSITVQKVSYSSNCQMWWSVPTPTHPWNNMSILLGEMTGDGYALTYTLKNGTDIVLQAGSFGGDASVRMQLNSSGTEITVTELTRNIGSDTYRTLTLTFYGTYK